MGIVFLGFALILFYFRIRHTGKTQILLWGSFVLFFLFAIILNTYLESVYHWEYGVPGADLSAHFKGARALANGTKLKDLYLVNSRFALRFSNIGYILYAFFLAIVGFIPMSMPVMFSLYLVYAIQCLAAVTACLNIAEFVTQENPRQQKSVFLMLVTCVSVSQMASVLMRDIWIVFFASLLMRQLLREKVNHPLCIALILFICLLRSYMILIVFPIYVYYGLDRKKEGIWSTVAISVVFLFGSVILDRFATLLNVLWEYDFHFSPVNIIQYFLFPNIVSQTHNVQNMARGYHVIFGGNNEWVYYLLAVWNCFTIPVVAWGVIKNIGGKDRSEVFFWLMNLINVGLLYAVFYNSVSEPRHKLMILYTYAYLFGRGIERMKVKTRVVYVFLITILLLLLFLAIS